jgi:signal transduction histidine kinase
MRALMHSHPGFPDPPPRVHCSKAALLRACVAACLLPAQAPAADWDESLGRALSGRLREIARELEQSAPDLRGLPGIPVDDQGGTGGWAGIHANATPAPGESHAVEIRWEQTARVDYVALVPARRYDARGLDARHGMPDAFSVELIDDSGAIVSQVARESGARSHPVRNGHPFLYRISPPVEASGLRISADLLHPDFEDSNGFTHAWAEVLAFEAERNLTSDARVSTSGGANPPAPWHWAPAFLVDGQTPLGLPELPEEHRNVGWLSEGRAKADVPATITVDLGESTRIDAVRLLPARRPTSDLPSGFGFPRRLVVSVSETDTADDWKTVAEWEQRNPGHNPVLLPFPARHGRHLRIEALELWKSYENYPAFFALSELEVLDGARNAALGKITRASDGLQNLIAPGGRYWTSAALNDGYGPDGRLVSTREWLELLDRRLRIETRRHQLREEAARVVNGWRRAALATFALLGLAGAIAIIAVPVRYRIRANRELLKVRERIAGDLHDEVGSNLGSIQMLADLAEGRSGPSRELKRIQRIAAETVSAVRDIVWLLRPGGDHRIATVEHLRETASIMLESPRWNFTANEEAWKIELPEETNRDLFLFFREALHNILRHAGAQQVDIRAEVSGRTFRLAIHDDGCGIPQEKLPHPATLSALRQRAKALGGTLTADSPPGAGTRLDLTIPLARRPRRTNPQPAGNAPTND